MAPSNVWALALGGPMEWSRLSPPGPQPYWRLSSTVYDPVHDRAITMNASTQGEGVWALDLSPAPAWRVLTPAGSAPPSRLAAAAIYDPYRGRVILHGGYLPGPGCTTQYWSDTWALQLVPPEQLAVDSPTPALRVSAAIPNPSRGQARLRLDLPRAASVRAEVYDLGGRLVHKLADETFAAGIREIAWNGSNRAGGRVPDGVYFLRVTVGSDRFIRRVVVLH